MTVIDTSKTRKNILKGAEILYGAVKTTMGPKGRNVLIKDKFGTFTITHDGATVAKAVQAKGEPYEIGIDLLKEASKEMDKIGDGTTTVTVLTYHLLQELLVLIEAKLNPMIIKRELDKILPLLIASVEEQSVVIDKTIFGVLDVARISSQDDEIAEMIASLVVGTGYEGTIAVSTVESNETTSELVEGYRFLSGYADEKFITDHISREAVIEDTIVVIIDGVMDTMDNYGGILGELKEYNLKNVIFIANGIEPELLNLFVLNKLKKVFNVAVIKNYFGREYLNDIAVVTGGKVYESVSEDTLNLRYAGKADKVVITAEETLIFGGQGDASKHVVSLKALSSTDALERRIGALNGKIGTIKVGGITQTQAEEKKHRVDDAVAATRAALKGGIVAGGGVTLRDISFDLDQDDVIEGAVAKALRQPERILLENSGYDLSDSTSVTGIGLNVVTGKIGGMHRSRIIDPTIVTVEVLRNAFAVAGMAITVGGSIVDEPISQEDLARLVTMSTN